MKNSTKILNILLLLLFFAGCKKDDNQPGDGKNGTHHEEELITSVLIIAFDSTNNVLDTIAYKDPDGVGGQVPAIDTLYLNRGSIYSVNIKFLDESNPAEVKDITIEIEAESDEHLVCYQLINVSDMHIFIEDSDGNFPLGLQSTWEVDSTAQSNKGRLQLLLKHQPDVKNGSCEPGDTDVEVFFPILVF